MAELEGQQKIQRYKIGTGSSPGLKVKKTSPGVMVVPIGKSKPSRPQLPERMGVGGGKATVRHKGRTDPKAASPKDPGPNPDTSKKGVQYVSGDRNIKQGYMKNRGWPLGGKGGSTVSEGVGADGPY